MAVRNDRTEVWVNVLLCVERSNSPIAVTPAQVLMTCLATLVCVFVRVLVVWLRCGTTTYSSMLQFVF